MIEFIIEMKQDLISCEIQAYRQLIQIMMNNLVSQIKFLINISMIEVEYCDINFGFYKLNSILIKNHTIIFLFNMGKTQVFIILTTISALLGIYNIINTSGYDHKYQFNTWIEINGKKYSE